MEEASFCGRCWAVSYCLTWDLTHLVPHGAQQKKKNRRIPQLFDRKQFCFYFLCLVYFKTDPRRALLVPPEADCTPQIAFCWLSELLLDWKSLWAVPVPAFSTLPSLLPLYGEAALTSWWSWVAAGCLGLRSSIDVWLFVLADSPKTSSMRQREREAFWRGWWFKGSLHKN